eukprot:8060589-Pyramimonas_sp.AAC.1
MSSPHIDLGYAAVYTDASKQCKWFTEVTEVGGNSFVSADKLNVGFKRLCNNSLVMLNHLIDLRNVATESAMSTAGA